MVKTIFVTTEKKNYLKSGPIYHTIKFFSESLLAIEKRKRKKADKPVYLGLLIIELRKIVICEFSYDHLKQNMEKMQKYVVWIDINL